LLSSEKSCGKVVSGVEIFFGGKDEPTKEEKQDMFDLLVVTLESQAEAGDFDEVGTVERVVSGSSSASGSGPNVPLVAGLLAAVVVVAGFIYKRRVHAKANNAGVSQEKGDETSDSDEDIAVPEAQVVAFKEGDESYKKKGKE
jgi:hypothetical protein